MDKYDSSQTEQTNDALVGRPNGVSFEYWPKIRKAASALWLALGLLVAVGIFSYLNTATLINTNNAAHPKSHVAFRIPRNHLDPR